MNILTHDAGTFVCPGLRTFNGDPSQLCEGCRMVYAALSPAPTRDEPKEPRA